MPLHLAVYGAPTPERGDPSGFRFAGLTLSPALVHISHILLLCVIGCPIYYLIIFGIRLCGVILHFVAKPKMTRLGQSLGSLRTQNISC
jgi:hypothetical protein